MHAPIALDPRGPAAPPAVDETLSDAMVHLQGDIQHTVVVSLMAGGLLVAAFAAALLLGRLCRAKIRGVALRDLGEFEDATRLWSAWREPSGLHSGACRSVFETIGGSFTVNEGAYGVIAAGLGGATRKVPLTLPAASAQPLCDLAKQFAAVGDISPRILTSPGSPSGTHWDFSDLPPGTLLDFHRQAIDIIRSAHAEKIRKPMSDDHAPREREKARLLAEAGESLRAGSAAKALEGEPR